MYFLDKKNYFQKINIFFELQNQGDLKDDNERAGIDFDLIARALKQLQKTPRIIESNEEDEQEGGEKLIQETLKVKIE